MWKTELLVLQKGQGGEPALMGLDFYKKVVEIQEKNRKPDQNIYNTIQTNGIVFNDEWGQFLAEHKFLVGISIDGPKELHDIHRFSLTKKSVFDRVMKACDILKKHNVEFNILTVVSNETVKYPVDIYNFFVTV